MSAGDSTEPLAFTVQLGNEMVPGQRWASIMLGNQSVFTELVYDNSKAPAELNIKHLFASRFRRLLEDQ